MRLLISGLCGGLFGAGLMVSGMTDTEKVRGFLDLFGAWDPTLIFVMGGAIVPMAVAWALTRSISAPILGTQFPARSTDQITLPLAVGSGLFGIGWGLSGLCPGPAMATLGFGGAGVWIFIIAMLLGMWLTPKLRPLLDGQASTG